MSFTNDNSGLRAHVREALEEFEHQIHDLEYLVDDIMDITPITEIECINAIRTPSSLIALIQNFWRELTRPLQETWNWFQTWKKENPWIALVFAGIAFIGGNLLMVLYAGGLL